MTQADNEAKLVRSAQTKRSTVARKKTPEAEAAAPAVAEASTPAAQPQAAAPIEAPAQSPSLVSRRRVWPD
ncbi:MAG: hypothetical protein HQL47_10060 [Gammaproteobacteria bacterium]|nr:hypothetical protein [Gammaproteobacteria bacterium]